MKLLIADDHTLFQDALRQYIERADATAQIHMVKNLSEVEQALHKDSSYDLVLLDLRMPGMRGMEGFKKIRDAYPDVRVALMSGVAESKDIQAALGLGAVGFFPKTLSGKALLQAIHLVLAGQKFVPIEHDTAKIMPSYYADEKYLAGYSGFSENQSSLQDMPKVDLTPRERDVLHHLLTGASNKEIANQLGLQVVTVKLHVRGICRKLNAKNRTHAVLQAKQMGLAH